MNTLLFGGSFDPVHNGHLHIVREALLALPPMGRVCFIPCAESPGKRPLKASPSQRTEFLHLALTGTSYEILTLELERPGPSYTVDTLEKLQQPGQTLFWLMGTDAYQGFTAWHRADTIRRLAHLVIVNREGLAPPVRQHERDILLQISGNNLSSTHLREQLAQGRVLNEAFPKLLEEHLKFHVLQSKNPYVSL